MAEYKLTRKAVEDLNRIWDYTVDKWSEEQADSYYGMLLDRCQDIAINPDLGKNYEEIAADLFGLRADRHVIFYRRLYDGSIEVT